MKKANSFCHGTFGRHALRRRRGCGASTATPAVLAASSTVGAVGDLTNSKASVPMKGKAAAGPLTLRFVTFDQLIRATQPGNVPTSLVTGD